MASESLNMFWEPRDIVGGDFYWIGQNKDWTSLIVADCTGHGIPGAFMTLSLSTLLDRVANLSDLSQPDRILDRLDELLRSTLKLQRGWQYQLWTRLWYHLLLSDIIFYAMLALRPIFIKRLVKNEIEIKG